MEVLLNVLPILEDDGFHQKCYMGPALMHILGTKIGSFVQIVNEEFVYVCSVWPRASLNDDAIQYSRAVGLKRNKEPETLRNADTTVETNEICATQTIEHNRITPVIVGKATELQIDVIVNNASQLQEYRSVGTCSKQLEESCFNCLFRLCVGKLCSVNLSKLNYASLLGISHIIVKAISSEGHAKHFTVTKSTKIKINSIHSSEWYEQVTIELPLKSLGGLASVVNMLLDLVLLPLKYKDKFNQLGVEPPKGILLRGPPGCGKTSVVQHIARACGAFLLCVNGPEIFGPLPGETEANLRQVFEKATLMSIEGPCILFVDEIDTVCPRKGKTGGVAESRVTGQFIGLMDGLQAGVGVLVIAATNRPSALDPAIRRPGRLDREVIISAPTQSQRREILECHLADLPVTSDLDLDTLSAVTNGYVGADLASLCHEAAYMAMAEGSDNGQINQVSQHHYMCALRKVQPSMQKGCVGIVDIRPVLWADIGGLHTVKTQIQQAVEWPLRHPEAFQRMGLPPPKGVLLYGPPGCCKTTLVRAAATACHTTFLSISGAQLYSPYVGDSERLIAEVFQKARASSPSIIFLDEIDSIVGKRSESGHSGVQERVLSALLNEMDGIGVRLGDNTGAMHGKQKLLEGQEQILENTNKDLLCDASHEGEDVCSTSVLVVAATNRPDLLDEALVRPGRIDKVIYVPPPDIQARRDILKVYTKGMTLSESDLDLLSSQTDLYTGADLENLCREAALYALTEDMTCSHVTATHYNKALLTVKPSLTQQLILQYSNVTMSTFKNKDL